MASARVRRFGQRTEVRTGLVGLLLGITLLLVVPALAGQEQEEEKAPAPSDFPAVWGEYRQIGRLVRDGDPDVLFARLEKMEPVLELAGRRIGEQVALESVHAVLVGRAHLIEGRPDPAAARLQIAIDHLEKQDWAEVHPALHPLIDWTYVDLMTSSAECQLAIGRPDQTIERLRRLLLLAEEEGLSGHFTSREDSLPIGAMQEGAACLLLGVALADLVTAGPTDLDDAREFLGRAMVNEELDSLDRFSAATHLTLLELEEGAIDAAGEALGEANELLAPNFSPREPAVLCALRARLIREDGEGREGLLAPRDDLVGAFETLCRSWRAKRRAPGQTASLRYERERLVIEELVCLDEMIDSPEAALERLVDAQAAVLYRPLERRGERWLDEIREELVPPGGGLLVYFPGATAVHLWVVDDRSVIRLELEEEDLLRAPIAAFNHALATPSKAGERASDALETQGPHLAEVLFPEVVRARLERWSAVGLVATGRLWGLHFRALPFGDGRLGEEKAIGFLPSLALGLALARREEPTWGDHEVLLLGAPPSPPGRPALEVSGSEWNRFLYPYAADRRRLFLGPEASAANLAASDLAGFPVVQFVAHGTEQYGRERSWSMALADGPLGSEGVEALPAGARGLVIVSACGAGRGPLRPGAEEVTTIAGAFLWKGARDVVLSRADATLDASLALGEPLHEAISSGTSPAEALRRASVAMVKDGEFDDPFHHSTVRVVGLAHRPYFPERELPARPSTWRWARWGLLLPLLVLIFFTLRRRRRDGAHS